MGDFGVSLDLNFQLMLRLKLPNNNITDEDIEVALTVHAKNHKLKHNFAGVGLHQDELVRILRPS
mgnify:CR=1 FL=1